MNRLVLALLTVWLSACAGHGATPWVELKGERFEVEIAADDVARARGLMFRRELAPDRGMLFIHDHEQPQAFWMKNTYIPLDILYFDRDRRLVSASLRTPPCSGGDRCPAYPSAGPALYTLELNAGIAERLGVSRGDELKLGPTIQSARP